MITGKKNNRDWFRGLCKDALSRDKSTIFAAVLDSGGKVIVGYANGHQLKDENDPESQKINNPETPQEERKMVLRLRREYYTPIAKGLEPQKFSD